MTPESTLDLDLALPERFEAHAVRRAREIAVTCEDRQISYRDLGDRVVALANDLLQLNVGPEVPVGIVLEPSIEMAVAVLAIWRAGGACSAVDPANASARAWLHELGTAAIVTGTRYARSAPDATITHICVDASRPHDAAKVSLRQPLHINQLACIIPASDAGGALTAVMIPHRAVANYVQWLQRTLASASDECVLHAMGRPIEARAWELCLPLIVGARVHVMARAADDPTALIETMLKERITTLVARPSILRQLVETGDLRHCGALRRVLCRAEPLPSDLSEALLAQVPVELCNVFGVRETAPAVTCWRCGLTDRAARPPIGSPIEGTQVYILDAHGRLVPPGIAGELHVGGASLGRGYWKRPGATADRFVPSPLSTIPGARLLRTGDRARWRANGVIEHLGRMDDARRPQATERSASVTTVARGYSPPRTPIECLLAEIWRETLAVDRVGLHEDFFDLGGDSILSMQVVAKAARRGVKLRVRHIFEHRTIAALVGVATIIADQSTRAAEIPRRQIAAGDVPLTPIQHQFFEQNLANPHHANQALLLAVDGWTFAQVEQLALSWLARCDALRLRFRRRGGDWVQSITAHERHRVTSYVDLSAIPASAWRAVLEREAQMLQASLDVMDGPLLRLAFFHGGAMGDRLLVIIHHLAIDAVSWRLLLMTPLRLAGPSFQQWADALARLAQTPAVAAHAPYWLAQASQRVPLLPIDDPRGANTMRLADAVSMTLSADDTRRLRQRLPALHASMHEMLLAALALALAEWTRETRFRLDIEGHGREDMVTGIDVSSTVGWFTTVYPLVIDLPSRANSRSLATWRDVLAAVAARVREVPERGFTYGLLRYLRDDPALQSSFAASPRPAISFNYLGHFEEQTSDPKTGAGGWRFADESPGYAQHPDDPRTHDIQCSATIVGMSLRVQLSYSRARYRRATMTALVESMRRTLLQASESELLTAVSAGDGDLLVDLHTFGQGAPLFCAVPYGDSPALVFRDLASELNAQHRVYGLSVPEDREFSYQTLAGQHVDAITCAQPTGPYVLAGYSLGGLVAFEIASQLEAAGHEVLLVLFETVCPVACIDLRTLSDAALLERILRRLDPDLVWPDDILHLPESERLVHMHTTACARPGLAFGIEDAVSLRGFLDLWRRRGTYVPGRFAGRMVLFRTTDMSILAEDFTLAWARVGEDAHSLGWRHVVEDLTVIDVPGAHANFLFRPHVRHVAAQLRSWLEANLVGLQDPPR
jgi:non-ribosomal peptide synthase protein (TIGR01720 family)